MTVRDRTATDRRVLTVVLAGLALTLGLVWHVRSTPPVYSSEVTLTLVAKSGTNSLREPQAGLVTAAELVRARIAAGQPPRPASDSVRLVDEGLRHGYSVTLVNRGSQWVQIVDRPDLHVQAVGLTSAEALRSLSMAQTRVERELDSIQVAVGVDPRARITVSRPQGVPYVSIARGNDRRAVVSSVTLGAALSAAALMATDRRRRAYVTGTESSRVRSPVPA